jgi:predicted PilT family ATPase
MNENPFKQEMREYPIDFTFPNQERFTINIKIPDGYAIENLPKQTIIEMPDSIMGFKYNVSTTGQQIQVLAVFDINQSIISHENYAALKNFFKEVINKETEKIVIAKI